MVKLMAVWRQAWGMLEAQEGNLELARQMLKCSVKADPSSQQSWQVGSSQLECCGSALSKRTPPRSSLGRWSLRSLDSANGLLLSS